MRAFLLLLVVAGCSSDECLQGVCADFENATKYPGPCRAGEVFPAIRTFEYDEAGRLTLATRVEDEPAHSDKDGDHPRRVAKTTGAWSYDADGRIASVISESFEGKTPESLAIRTRYSYIADGEQLRWVEETCFPECMPYMDRNGIFDRAAFTFAPLRPSRMTSPWHRSYAAIELYGDPVTTTIEGARRIQKGSETFIFDHDDAGRIVRYEIARMFNGYLETYQYDGDRLVRLDNNNGGNPHYVELHYDAGGNVVEEIEDGHLRYIYDYDCWR